MSGDQEPWVFRGGVQGELQVCIPGNPKCSTSKPVVHWFVKCGIIIVINYFPAILTIHALPSQVFLPGSAALVQEELTYCIM